MGISLTLNESPSEKEGKFCGGVQVLHADALNESPSEKEGKCCWCGGSGRWCKPLNESPSEKEGKSVVWATAFLDMSVPQ